MTSDALGRLTLRDAATGATVGCPVSGHVVKPAALAAVTADLLLALDQDGTLHLLPVTGELDVPGGAEHLTYRHNATTLASPDARPTAVAAHRDRVVVGDAQGAVHLWSLTDHHTGPRTVQLHRTPFSAVACLVLPEAGTVLVLTGGLDGTVRLWDSATGEAMPGPVERRNAVPTALALVDTDIGPVLAVAWSDRQLHVWQLFQGRMTALPLLDVAEALALTADGLVVVGGRAGTSALRLDLGGLPV